MVSTEIRLLFFAAEDGEALYSEQKQDWELTVPQIMNSLLLNSDLNWERRENHYTSYDLNQIPYDYTAEATNKFKGLYKIESAWRL